MFSLSSINPFNECFYYNCVHSCLFAIIDANGGDFRKIMISGIPHYAVDNNTQRVYTEFDFLGDYDQMLLDQGIISEQYLHMDVDECIEYAIQCIRNNKPIIINVDCYELVYRGDLYHQGEWPHSLLVFGYDEYKDSFTVMDQPTRDTVEFKVYNISRIALKRAIILYDNNRGKNCMYFGDMIASFECKCPGKIYTSKILFHEWRDNRKKVIHHIEKGNYAAKEQFKMIVNRMSDETYTYEYGNSIIDGLNDIVKQKRWENFLLKELMPEDATLCVLHSELLQKWILLRKKIALMVLSGRQRKKTLDSIPEMIEKIFLLENTYAYQWENVNEDWN